MKKGIISALIVSALTSSIYAATQGTLVHGVDKNISSEGSLDLLLEIPYAIQVNKLNDIDFGNFNALDTGNLNKGDRFCVFTNAPSFNISFFSANPLGSTPRLTSINNSSLTIPYSLQLGQIDMTKTRYSLNGINHAETVSNILEVRNRLNCQMNLGGGSEFYPNLVVRVKIEENDLLDTVPDSYKDVLTIVASPE
jgi:hypothetical protein